MRIDNKLLMISLIFCSFLGLLTCASIGQENLNPQSTLVSNPESKITRQRRQFNSGVSGSNANSNAFSQNIGGSEFSSANANANAFNEGFGQNGFGGSTANANAQSFESGGPLGSFGASSANSASEGFNIGPNGFSGSASFAESQTYELPGNREISVSFSEGFGVGPDGRPTFSEAEAISES
ncbi:uncharacterized protein LOC129723998 isoform X2 [Wyeomyia smithii]|uniref:uncharacterized protein LOC129723998 isoform X2 n=1 Tax=Wyeomyia smithii TaxID=174621 RepID=UPI0024681E4B|nr:uncharacterized protein LOC129723998 isoform X2 [Wyeomyia smithii]